MLVFDAVILVTMNFKHIVIDLIMKMLFSGGCEFETVMLGN